MADKTQFCHVRLGKTKQGCYVNKEAWTCCTLSDLPVPGKHQAAGIQ